MGNHIFFDLNFSIIFLIEGFCLFLFSVKTEGPKSFNRAFYLSIALIPILANIPRLFNPAINADLLVGILMGFQVGYLLSLHLDSEGHSEALTQKINRVKSKLPFLGAAFLFSFINIFPQYFLIKYLVSAGFFLVGSVIFRRAAAGSAFLSYLWFLLLPLAALLGEELKLINSSYLPIVRVFVWMFAYLFLARYLFSRHKGIDEES